MLYLDGELLNQEHSGAEWPAPVLRDPRLRESFERLYAHCVGGTPALGVEEALAVLLARAALGARTHPGRAAVRGAPATALAQARELLADTTVPAPSLADCARRAGVSRYQFLRAFATAYGLPPHAWAQQCRLARAQALIRQGESLADAALAAGFADQSHMTRAFRRFRGYTPGAYAAALR